MKIAKFVSPLLAVLTGLFLLSCEKFGEKDEPTKDSATLFTFAVNEAGANGAEIIVRHTGKASEGWYSFLTSNLDTETDMLVSAEAKDVTKDKIHYGKVQTVAINDLTEQSTYRIVAFFVDEDGKVNSLRVPGSYVFSTTPDFDIQFIAEVSDVTNTGANVTISHYKHPEFNFTGFLTEDLSTDVKTLVNQHFASITQDGAIKEGVTLFTGDSQIVSLTELSSGIRYRYIAYGIYVNAKKKASIYGTPADVTFKTINFYHEIDDWALSVSENDTTHEGYPFKVTNTVASGSTAGKYFFTFFTKEQVDEVGGDMDDVVAANAVSLVKELKEEALEQGKELTDFLHEGTSSSYYSLVFDTYYMTAIGVEEDGTPNGQFAFTTFTYDPTQAQKDAYNKWIGQWSIGSDVWIISEAKPWVSYSVNGFASAMGYDFTAVFDPQSDRMIIYRQELEEYTHPTYGKVSISLDGCVPRADGDGYAPVDGYYVIASAALNADGSAGLTPGTVTTGNGTITLSGMNIYGHILEGQYEGYYLTFNASPEPLLLPDTLQPIGDEGSEAYNAWLGRWTITRPEYTEEDEEGDNEPTGNLITDIWEITQNVADHSYYISGLDKYSDPVKAEFNAETGHFTISEQEITSFVSAGTTYLVYLMGLFEDNEDIWGGTETILEASLNADGTATLIGLDFSGDTTEGIISSTFSGMEIFILNASTYRLVDMGADHWNEFYTFPCQLTPAAGGVTMTRAGNASATRSANMTSFRHVDAMPMAAPIAPQKEGPRARSQYNYIR